MLYGRLLFQKQLRKLDNCFNVTLYVIVLCVFAQFCNTRANAGGLWFVQRWHKAFSAKFELVGECWKTVGLFLGEGSVESHGCGLTPLCS